MRVCLNSGAALYFYRDTGVWKSSHWGFFHFRKARLSGFVRSRVVLFLFFSPLLVFRYFCRTVLGSTVLTYVHIEPYLELSL